ncbi:MAG: alanine--tRNA ligase [Acutalibacteraceae bacterium]
MQWTGLNELREKYLSFFESKGHLRLPSFSLVPNGDKSLLLINSGMAPMKKYFTGEVTPPRKRVTTCQKCIRTPDIERVGITARHGTYFEMLGNFSFGDYFKHEATAWAWEFFTKVLEMPEEKLYVSIYENDDEAYKIWTEEVGVDPSHMVRLGKEDNFWEHGTGPCGPCSEIYFDRGEEKGCGKPGCAVGCECDRFVEVWNLVFTQFDSDGKGNYTPLEHPNIDTGMGLERLACVMQGVDNLFLVDTVQRILDHVQRVTGVKYGEDEKSDISLRVITDHIRSTTFMIGDGVMPSNEGRGYVLRRLLRRAARHGRLLGVKDRPFLYEICQTVIEENANAYPELVEKKEFITKLIKVEEENFARTIDQGFALLHEIINNEELSELSGEDAFKLNDTYGFPIDLTKEILAEKGMTVDEERFKELLLEQKKRAKAARKNAGADAWISESTDISDIPATQFTGYTNYTEEAKLLAVIKQGKRETSAYKGEEAVLIFDKTPFYAESGGQIGDSGCADSGNAKAEINTTSKNHTGVFMHSAVITDGMLSVGDTVKLEIDSQKREDIMRNHTAAHLLQAALRQVLGTHVEQAGQLVTDEKLRFDFTHFSALTAQELVDVEELINKKIFEAIDVAVKEMPIEEAKKMGAMALFGEKYGDVVRVVKAGDFSTELCGGTHVDNTSKIGMIKIMSEQSVASGVRRIEAYTGRGVMGVINNCLQVIGTGAQLLKINNSKLFVEGCTQIAQELKNKDKEIEELNAKIADMTVGPLFKASKIEKGVRIISSAFTDIPADMLRQMCDKVLAMAPKAVVTIASIQSGKVTFACACGGEAQQKGAHAGKIVKEVAAIAGGKGGGKADMAMAGAKDVTKVDEAIIAAREIVLNMVHE